MLGYGAVHWREEGGRARPRLDSTSVPGGQRLAGRKSCFLVHSFHTALRLRVEPRKFPRVNACRTGDFTPAREAPGRSVAHRMNDRPVNSSGHLEPPFVDIDAATRRLMSALDALESAVERRREADRDEDELATRIQALGADRSRLADELDGSLVKSRKLERANREIAERLDAAIGKIRAVLGEGDKEKADEDDSDGDDDG